MNLESNIDIRRTFGIISHPDAGKTTLTEKLLLFGGAINEAGAVKSNKIKKTATSDFMEIEKQRGISVSTSVLSFNYQGKKINILDTPGHKDFAEDTFRTLTAVDSVIVVIDVAKGVEEQTEKLVKVCQMRNIPIMIFINKCDREGKDQFDLFDELEKKLNFKISPITYPIGLGYDYSGIIDLLSERTILFLDKLSTPLRPGTHANSAFSFSLMIEYAIIANDIDLLNTIKEFSIKNFLKDTNCPVNYEPSGTDFLSPCLAEAGLMSFILDSKEFNNWIYKFFPSFDEKDFGKIINTPEVLDPLDPGIGHLIGLMFHRAWTLKDIAGKVEDNKNKRLFQKIAQKHSEQGYRIMFKSGYGGEHWLATFAIYNFSK